MILFVVLGDSRGQGLPERIDRKGMWVYFAVSQVVAVKVKREGKLLSIFYDTSVQRKEKIAGNIGIRTVNRGISAFRYAYSCTG